MESAEPARQHHRWATVIDHLSAAVPDDAASVVVDGADWRATLLAERLTDAPRARHPATTATITVGRDAQNGCSTAR